MMNTTINPERQALKAELSVPLEHYEVLAGVREVRFPVPGLSLEARIEAEAKRQWAERHASKLDMIRLTCEVWFSMGYWPFSQKRGA